jgi:hypothetical protein
MGMERVQLKDAKFCGEEAPFVDNTGATVSSVHFRSQVGRPLKKLAGSLSASIAAYFPELDWFLASVRRPSGSRLTRRDCFPIDMHVPVVQLSVEDIRSPGPSPQEMNKRALLEVDRPTPIGEAPLPRNVLRIATVFATLALSHSTAPAKVEGLAELGTAISNDNAVEGLGVEALDFFGAAQDFRFARSHWEGNSKVLSLGGRLIFIDEASDKDLDGSGGPPAALVFDLSPDFASGASVIGGSSFPATVKDFAAVDLIIESLTLGEGSDVMTESIVVGSNAWQALTLTFAPLEPPRKGGAPCSSDDSSSGVMRCEILEEAVSTGSTSTVSYDADQTYYAAQTYGADQTGPQSIAFGGGRTVWAGGARLPQSPASAFSPVIFTSDPFVPKALTADGGFAPTYDLDPASGGSTDHYCPGPFVVTSPLDPPLDPPLNPPLDPPLDPPGAATPSVPEIPSPFMLLIGFGGLALIPRRLLSGTSRPAWRKARGWPDP